MFNIKNKIFTICFVLFLCILLLKLNQLNEYSYIKAFNNNINTGLKLLTTQEELAETLNNNFKFLGGMGGRYFISTDEKTSIVFSGFPDVIDEFKLTNISTINKEFSFYNIHIGDSIENVLENFANKDFTVIDTISKQHYKVTLKNKKLVIVLYFDMGYLEKIEISLIATNKNNVDF